METRIKTSMIVCSHGHGINKNFIGIIDDGVEENGIDENNNEAFEGGGDIDELLELIDILIPYFGTSTSSSSTCTIKFPPDGEFSRQTFLSILRSMANVHLASVAITDEMIMMTRKENDENNIIFYVLARRFHSERTYALVNESQGI